MKFMYVETPVELDEDYEHFAAIKDKEITKVKLEKQEDDIREAFKYYGEKGINWVLSQRPAVRSDILSDTVFMNMYHKSKNIEEKNNILPFLSISMRTYGVDSLS